MAFSLFPKLRYRSIYAISAQSLKEQGIRLLLLDLDNTISPYHVGKPSEELLAWLAQLRREGITPFILSNSRKQTRVPNFAVAAELDFVRHAGKPKRKGFLQAMEQVGISPAETAIVGDQIFTDILGGNRSGIRTILVHPLRLDSVPRVMRFRVETTFGRRAKLQVPKKDA